MILIESAKEDNDGHFTSSRFERFSFKLWMKLKEKDREIDIGVISIKMV